MTEIWKDVAGYEGRYQISSLGRVKSLPFLQRYLLRNGLPSYRQTKEKTLCTQIGYHGYELVCLNLDNVRVGRSVHSLVADAFLFKTGREVNHKNGNKQDNRVENLEWCSSTENKLHAVSIGLNLQAIPASGYPSIAQARKALHRKNVQ